jgi:hypothetical protein
VASRLSNWPVQISLVPPKAPYLEGADVLIAADCAPFAYGDFHRRFMEGKVLLIGCPKLDNTQAYVEKLSHMFRENSINSRAERRQYPHNFVQGRDQGGFCGGKSTQSVGSLEFMRAWIGRN